MSASQSAELLSAGHTCSHSACNTIDFLPFKCHHCSQPFCQDHWKPEIHSCPKYDAAAHDRVVPQCPLCNDPVVIPQGRDPNEVMDWHILTNCSVALTKKKRGPHCANNKCGKALITPIVCQDCKQQFCPTHRFPSAHTCRPAVSTASTSATASSAPNTPAGLAAFKRAAASTVTNTNTAIANAKAKAAAIKANHAAAGVGSSTPKFVQEIKTDRRSKAEEKIRAKAMEFKAKKGLLTPAEKKEWEEAQKNMKEDKDSDCVIM